jgi:hypothetical protein
MKYIVLIYSNEALDTPESAAESMPAYFAYSDMLASAGKAAGQEALHPTATAKSIRVRDGKTLVTDGPFAETKEQLGGYYLIEAKDLDEAIALAAKCPGAQHGTIELRPCVDFSQMG